MPISITIHMIDKQQTAIFKSNQDFNKNKRYPNI